MAMKARCSAAAPTKPSPNHPCSLEISQHKNKKCFTFEAGMLLKTKGGEMANCLAPNEFMKTKQLSCFANDFMIPKELARILVRQSPNDWPIPFSTEGVIWDVIPFETLTVPGSACRSQMTAVPAAL